MIEFRTIIKVTDKESIVSSLTRILNELSPALRMHTEQNERIGLICIFFDTVEQARTFLDRILREDLELNSWALYDNNELLECNT